LFDGWSSRSSSIRIDSFDASWLTSPFHVAQGDDMDTFEQPVEKYHATLMEFVKGNAEPTLEVWSQRDDVVLCNPLRPFAHGPAELAETTRAAALNFADGEYIFETVEKYVTPELGYIIEIERFKAMVGGKEGSGALRVTTILRPEDDGWRVCHRHADAITTPQELGSILEK
jgi:ketosteroid isomerase-like protein